MISLRFLLSLMSNLELLETWFYRNFIVIFNFRRLVVYRLGYNVFHLTGYNRGLSVTYVNILRILYFLYSFLSSLLYFPTPRCLEGT